jgi:hypothetical protein
MPALIVLPQERDILLDLHAVDERIFNYLAERTDYATGNIGIKSAVSYSRMALELSENIPRKAITKQVRISRKQAEVSVNRMNKVQLLTRINTSSSNKKLTLVRPYWQKIMLINNSVQNPDGSQLGQLMIKLNSGYFNTNSHLQNDSKSRWETNTRPDGTNLSTTTTNNSIHSFAMHDDWQPSEHFAERVKTAGFNIQHDDKLLYDYALVEMRMYWMSDQPDRTYNQIGWERTLLKSMQHTKVQGVQDAITAPQISSVGINTPKTTTKPGTPSKPTIPPVPNPSNEAQLLRWIKAAGAPQPDRGESTPRYCNRMKDWRNRKIRDAKYGNVH